MQLCSSPDRIWSRYAASTAFARLASKKKILGSEPTEICVGNALVSIRARASLTDSTEPDDASVKHSKEIPLLLQC